MADVNKAIDFVLRQEDSKLAGICTNSPADRGGLTRFGIAAKWHPELVRVGYYQALRDDALVTARKVYAEEYASFLSLPAIKSQSIANALLSFAILENAGRSALEMQNALNTLGCRVTVDGSIGPQTLKAINGADPGRLLVAFVESNRAYLLGLIAKDVSQVRWRNGWMNRCNAVAKQSTEVLV